MFHTGPLEPKKKKKRKKNIIITNNVISTKPLNGSSARETCDKKYLAVFFLS